MYGIQVHIPDCRMLGWRLSFSWHFVRDMGCQQSDQTRMPEFILAQSYRFGCGIHLAYYWTTVVDF